MNHRLNGTEHGSEGDDREQAAGNLYFRKVQRLCAHQPEPCSCAAECRTED